MNKEIKDFIDEKVEQFKSELIKSIEEKENKPKTVWVHGYTQGVRAEREKKQRKMEE